MTASSKPTAKPSFSRIIPREEIGAVRSWHFSAVDGSEPEPPIEPEEPAAAPAPDAEERLQAALDQAREEAFAAGFAQGHDTGSRETREALEVPIQQAAADTAERMAQLLHGMTEQLIAAEQKMSRQLLDLACDLARQVVRQELMVNTQHMRPVIEEALEQVIDDGLPATVRLNPNDLALLQDSLTQAMGENAPELVADDSVSPGGCIVQTPHSLVDASVEKRWARAIGNLGLSVPWNPEDTDV